MKKLILDIDCKCGFDRVGEGVIYEYEIHYDWESIIKKNFNNKNFKVITSGIISTNSERYLKTYHMSKIKWEEKMFSILSKDNYRYAKEELLSKMPDSEVKQYQELWV